jgi:hypothetical protein
VEKMMAKQKAKRANIGQLSMCFVGMSIPFSGDIWEIVVRFLRNENLRGTLTFRQENKYAAMPKTGKPILPATIIWNEFSCYESDVNMATERNTGLGGTNRGDGRLAGG